MNYPLLPRGDWGDPWGVQIYFPCIIIHTSAFIITPCLASVYFLLAVHHLRLSPSFFILLLLTLLPPSFLYPSSHPSHSSLILDFHFPLQPNMVQRFELPLRHPKEFVQKSRRPRNLRISKRHYCFSRKRRLSLRWFKRKHIRPSRHVRIRSHGDASMAKVHKLQLPDLTLPNKATLSSPQPESVSTQPLDGISTEGLPSSWIPPEGTTFHPSFDATSLTSEQPQVNQDDTANTLHNNEDEGFISAPESGYSDCELEYEGDYENGRVYCPGRKYHFPIDKKQRETAEFMMHLMWKKYSQVWQESLNIQKIQ